MRKSEVLTPKNLGVTSQQNVQSQEYQDESQETTYEQIVESPEQHRYSLILRCKSGTHDDAV